MPYSSLYTYMYLHFMLCLCVLFVFIFIFYANEFHLSSSHWDDIGLCNKLYIYIWISWCDNNMSSTKRKTMQSDWYCLSLLFLFPYDIIYCIKTFLIILFLQLILLSSVGQIERRKEDTGLRCEMHPLNFVQQFRLLQIISLVVHIDEPSMNNRGSHQSIAINLCMDFSNIVSQARVKISRWKYSSRK